VVVTGVIGRTDVFVSGDDVLVDRRSSSS